MPGGPDLPASALPPTSDGSPTADGRAVGQATVIHALEKWVICLKETYEPLNSIWK